MKKNGPRKSRATPPLRKGYRYIDTSKEKNSPEGKLPSYTQKDDDAYRQIKGNDTNRQAEGKDTKIQGKGEYTLRQAKIVSEVPSE